MWNKKSVLEWFIQHVGEDVVIRKQGTTLRIEGQAEGVEELDACSSLMVTTQFAINQAGVDLALSFHDKSLAIHLVLYGEASRKPAASLPFSIPYPRLRLETMAEEAAKKRAEADAQGATPFSPYELLH